MMSLLSFSSLLQLLLLCLVLFVSSSTSPAAASPPVCPNNHDCGNKDNNNNDDDGDSSDSSTISDFQCGLYMIPSWSEHHANSNNNAEENSNHRGGIITLYAGKDIRKGTKLLKSMDPIISLIDASKNEWSPWQDYFWRSDFLNGAINGNAAFAHLENDYYHDLFVAGIGSIVPCVTETQYVNAIPNTTDAITLVSLMDNTNNNNNKNTNPAAGSFSYRYASTYQATQNIVAGDEIRASCNVVTTTTTTTNNNDDNDEKEYVKPTRRSVEWLNANAYCLDTLDVRRRSSKSQQGTIDIGNGAYSKSHFTAGDTILTSPVIMFDRSQMDRVMQHDNNNNNINYNNEYYDAASESSDASTTQAEVPLPPPKVPNMRDEHDMEYNATHVIDQQLLINYCYGWNNSNVLLLPFAPGINSINHYKYNDGNDDHSNNSQQQQRQQQSQPNAYIRWNVDTMTTTTTNHHHNDLFSMTVHELFDQQGEPDQLMIDVAALRDIKPGEEILIDYGDSWQKAWDEHVRSFEKNSSREEKEKKDGSDSNNNINKHSVSAAEFYAKNPVHKIRTLTELDDNDDEDFYPSNLQTVCAFMPDTITQRLIDQEEESLDDDDDEVDHERPYDTLVVQWQDKFDNCWRPCDIVSKSTDKTNGDGYEVIVYDRATNYGEPEYCGEMSENGVRVSGIPSRAVRLADKPYTTDQFMKGAFRHEIGLPQAMMPSLWNRKDRRPNGDFLPTPLQPGELQLIRWASTGNIVQRNAYRLGLPPKIRETLLIYCNAMGITEMFRHVTTRGNALEPGSETYLTIEGDQWYLQRPEPKWESNLQWLSPGENPAHEHYLQALGVSGFDDMLEAIGTQLGLDSLVAFHVTFIAVSHSTRGFMHYDVKETGDKTFNIIIPLLLAEETGPELDLQNAPGEGDDLDEEEDGEDAAYRVGRYRYEYDVASLMGDESMHASSAVDYRSNPGAMRMAATVYIADVNESNVDQILNEYTQAYPPDDRDLLLSWSGRHWKKDDPTVKLPKPKPGHILLKQQNKGGYGSATTTASVQ